MSEESQKKDPSNNSGQDPSTGSGQEEELQQPPSQNELEGKLAECEKQRDDYLAGWQRAKADFINFKKEEMTRLQDVSRYATEDLIRELIITLDNFDLAIGAMEKAGAVEKGVYLIRTQLADALGRRGLQAIHAKIGEPFDPQFQEALVLQDSDKPGGTVLEELEVGYKLNDKILRPVRVKVAKEKQ